MAGSGHWPGRLIRFLRLLPFPLLVGAVLLASSWIQADGTKAASDPIDIDDLLRKVLLRAGKDPEENRQFDQSYAYKHTRVTEYRNGKGEVKEREEKTRENDPASREKVGDSRRPRSSRVNSLDEPGFEEESGPEEKKEVSRRDFRVDEEVLQRFNYEVVGRESREGREVLILDFQPADGDLPERSLVDKFINRTAGRLWIDSQDHAICQARFRLTEEIQFLGGILGVIRSFTFEFVRERVPEGLWFTRNVDWRLEGRQFLAPKFINFHEEKTDLHRVVETAADGL